MSELPSNPGMLDCASDEPLTLSDLFRLLLARWLWVAATVAAFGALALAAGFLITPVYRATSVLIPAGTINSGGLGASFGGELGSLGGLAALAGLNLGSKSDPTEEALAVLRSRQFTEAFIREKNLMPVLFEHSWDSAKRAWKNASGDEPTYAMAYRRFDRGIRTVFMDKKTGLVTLQVDWKDRAVSASWANELVRRLNEEMRQRAIKQADASLKFLQQELEGTAIVETRLAINRLIEGQVNMRMLANVTSEYAFRVVDPAMVPDRHDVVRPRKLLLLVLGICSGGVAGVLLVLLFGQRRKRV